LNCDEHSESGAPRQQELVAGVDHVVDERGECVA
jgi:hypothetical protein